MLKVAQGMQYVLLFADDALDEDHFRAQEEQHGSMLQRFHRHHSTTTSTTIKIKPLSGNFKFAFFLSCLGGVHFPNLMR